MPEARGNGRDLCLLTSDSWPLLVLVLVLAWLDYLLSDFIQI
jgi:hypothetical protein